MKRNLVALIALIPLALALVACGGGDSSGDSKASNKTTPMTDLIKAGKAPIEVSKLTPVGISPIAPQFKATVINLSDVPVELITGTVVFYDAQGDVIAAAIKDASYADSISSGGRVTLSLFAADDQAVSGTWVIKSLAYRRGGTMYSWKNPNFEAELTAAKSKQPA